MRAGQLKQRIVIQQCMGGQNTLGELATVRWKDFARVWAKVEPLSGQELFAAQQLLPEVNRKITIRYLGGVMPNMRALLRVREFDILFIADPDGRFRTLEMLCVERPPSTNTGTPDMSKPQRYALTGVVDGVNTIFTIAVAPDPSVLAVFWNGVLIPADRYTLLASTITFNTPPDLETLLEAYA